MVWEISLGNISDNNILGDYYLDFSKRVTPVMSGCFGPFDADGVPLVDNDKLFNNSPIVGKKDAYGIHYTPVTIAQFGLSLYSSHLQKPNPKYYNLFISQADWHVNNISATSDGGGVWLHNFEFPIYNLHKPWISAMAQGQGISLVLRAYQATKNSKYLDAACRAYQSLNSEVITGGVSTRDHLGNLWLEEYPTDPPSHVLNGFIFAIWGVLDFYRATNDINAGIMYKECIKTLRDNIKKYEGVFWSKYDIHTRENISLSYHMIHVMQLQVLAQLTNDSILIETARRWGDYATGKYSIVRTAYRYTRALMRRLGFCNKKLVKGISFSSERIYLP